LTRSYALITYVNKIKVETFVSEKVINFEFEKHNKNSIRYKEVPENGMPPVLGSIYVQKWFAGDSKNIEVTIKIKDKG
jgi:hypothetical protein